MVSIPVGNTHFLWSTEERDCPHARVLPCCDRDFHIIWHLCQFWSKYFIGTLIGYHNFSNVQFALKRKVQKTSLTFQTAVATRLIQVHPLYTGPVWLPGQTVAGWPGHLSVLNGVLSVLLYGWCNNSLKALMIMSCLALRTSCVTRCDDYDYSD